MPVRLLGVLVRWAGCGCAQLMMYVAGCKQQRQNCPFLVKVHDNQHILQSLHAQQDSQGHGFLNTDSTHLSKRACTPAGFYVVLYSMMLFFNMLVFIIFW